MPAVSGIKETCLTVADVDRSEAFYRGLFGFSVLEGESRFRALNVADTHVLLLFAEGQSTEPMPLPGGIIPPHDAHGQSHVAFAISTDQVKAWKSRLAEHQIAIESIVTWPRGGTSVYFRDPDGHLLELITPGVWQIW
jgi:catechol 2,3-dioxygenase-like lactoylglutathione lyase family enzyme